MDQASGLRIMQPQHAVKVIAITGGKGGVGKTSVTINLAYALAQAHKRVLILDADLGLANVDVMFGIRPEHDLADVILKGYTLKQVLCHIRPKIAIIPAASGVQGMMDLTAHHHAHLIQAFNSLEADFDFLLIDTAAGISDMVLNFAIAAQEKLVVVCDEPTSMTDAYALMKILSNQHDQKHFQIVANMVKNTESGRLLYKKMAQVAHRFLDVTLEFAGAIPWDKNVKTAIRHQQILMEKYPETPAAIALEALTHKILRWPTPQGPQGKIEFFIESLCQTQPH